jgi:hypothetical protein
MFAPRIASPVTIPKVAALSDEGFEAEDLKRLEAQLGERGEHIRVLERGMREAERTGRELVRKLERSSAAEPRAAAVEAPVPAPTPVEPPGLMPAAAVRLAELEAERVVLTWALQIARGERRPDAPGPA